MYIACPAGNKYLDCSWNLSCSNITGVRRCKEQTPCTSGCFCSDGTVLKDGVCSNISSCSGITLNTHTVYLYCRIFMCVMNSWYCVEGCCVNKDQSTGYSYVHRASICSNNKLHISYQLQHTVCFDTFINTF